MITRRITSRFAVLKKCRNMSVFVILIMIVCEGCARRAADTRGEAKRAASAICLASCIVSKQGILSGSTIVTWSVASNGDETVVFVPSPANKNGPLSDARPKPICTVALEGDQRMVRIVTSENMVKYTTYDSRVNVGTIIDACIVKAMILGVLSNWVEIIVSPSDTGDLWAKFSCSSNDEDGYSCVMPRNGDRITFHGAH